MAAALLSTLPSQVAPSLALHVSPSVPTPTATPTPQAPSITHALVAYTAVADSASSSKDKSKDDLGSPLSALTLPAIGSTLTAKSEEDSAADADNIQSRLTQSNQLQIYNQPHYHIVAAAEFFDGYTFRQQIEFCKVALSCLPMVFTSDGIRIIRGNGDNSLVASIFMREKDLTHFYVDKKYYNSKALNAHVMSVNLAEFHSHIKATAKKDGFRIWQYAEYPDIVLCQLYGGNKNSDSGHIIVRTEKYDHLTYSFVDSIKVTDSPNAKVPLASFCNACNNIVRVKYHIAKLEVYPKGAHLMGGNETRSSSRNAQWGDCSMVKKSRFISTNKAPEPVQVFTTTISLPVVKALVKMANFNTGGVVRIYCKDDGLVRLEVSIGCYAEICCYVREPDEPQVQR